MEDSLEPGGYSQSMGLQGVWYDLAKSMDNNRKGLNFSSSATVEAKEEIKYIVQDWIDPSG